MTKILLAITISALCIVGNAYSADFRSLSWGDTEKTIVKHLGRPNKKVDKNTLLYFNRNVGAYQCDIEIILDGNRLESAAYIFHPGNNPQIDVSDFFLLEKKLDKKYGNPRNADQWFSTLFRKNPAHYGTALQLGLVRFLRIRETSRSKIVHTLQWDKKKSRTMHIIIYENRRKSEEDERQREREEMDAL